MCPSLEPGETFEQNYTDSVSAWVSETDNKMSLWLMCRKIDDLPPVYVITEPETSSTSHNLSSLWVQSKKYILEELSHWRKSNRGGWGLSPTSEGGKQFRRKTLTMGITLCWIKQSSLQLLSFQLQWQFHQICRFHKLTLFLSTPFARQAGWARCCPHCQSKLTQKLWQAASVVC